MVDEIDQTFAQHLKDRGLGDLYMLMPRDVYDDMCVRVKAIRADSLTEKMQKFLRLGDKPIWHTLVRGLGVTKIESMHGISDDYEVERVERLLGFS